MEIFDVAIVGAGPAGSACAAFCALAGLRPLVLEREKFPREKVCGDCLNPAAWPVLQRLGIAERVRQLPHAILNTVEFIAIGGRKVAVHLPSGEEGEVSIKRSLLDGLLLSRARGLGTRIYEETTVTALTAGANGSDWKIETDRGSVFVSQTLVGDDERVVEPFTGEGIYYALRSGELAAQAIVKIIGGNYDADPASDYAKAHAAMYRGRLWVNQMSRAAVLSPRLSSLLVHFARIRPGVLRLLTRKIVS